MLEVKDKYKSIFQPDSITSAVWALFTFQIKSLNRDLDLRLISTNFLIKDALIDMWEGIIDHLHLWSCSTGDATSLNAVITFFNQNQGWVLPGCHVHISSFISWNGVCACVCLMSHTAAKSGQSLIRYLTPLHQRHDQSEFLCFMK